jgi:hypothetical protein
VANKWHNWRSPSREYVIPVPGVLLACPIQ